MSVGPLVVEILCVFVLSAYILHKYGDWRKQHPLVTIIVFVSWYFSFIIIFVLPLDVTTTFYRQCRNESQFMRHPTTAPTDTLVSRKTTREVSSNTLTTNDLTTAGDNPPNRTRREAAVQECKEPWSYVPEHILPIIWSIVYWTSYMLTWIVMPMMKSYVSAGAFTIRGKLKTAVVENAIWYGSYLLIFGVFLIYVAISPSIHLDAESHWVIGITATITCGLLLLDNGLWKSPGVLALVQQWGESLRVIGVTASNTWGLLLLVLLLGYGLVEVPRKYWHQSRKGYLLNYVYFQLAKLSTEKSEAEEHLEDVLEDVRRVSDVVKYNHPSRRHVNTIISKCPDAFQDSLTKHLDDFQEYGQRQEQIPTENDLVKLHSKVMYAGQAKRRSATHWDLLVEKAFELEDVQNNEKNHSKTFDHTYDPNYTGLKSYICTPSWEWHWRIFLMPSMLKGVAVVLAVCSLMVIWSEMTFFSLNPVLSLFAVFVNTASNKNNYLLIELLCIVIMAYLSWCCYYTVFKIRIFDFYFLASHHQTDENSLIFCGMMLCRLTPPLCLNFLSLIHLGSYGNAGQIQTSYTMVMGHSTQLLPFIQSGFEIYYPIVVALLCCATFLNLGSRFLSCLGFQQFVGDDDMTEDMIQEGLQLMKREKRKRERALKSESRKRYIEKIKPTGKSQRMENINNSNQDYRRFDDDVPSAKFSKDPSNGQKQVEIFTDTEGVDFSEKANTSFGEDFSASGASSDSSVGRSHRQKPRGIFDDV